MIRYASESRADKIGCSAQRILELSKNFVYVGLLTLFANAATAQGSGAVGNHPPTRPMPVSVVRLNSVAEVQPLFYSFGRPSKIVSENYTLSKQPDGSLAKTSVALSRQEVTFNAKGQVTSVLTLSHEGTIRWVYRYDKNGYLSESQLVLNGKPVNNVGDNSPTYYHYRWQGTTITVTQTGPDGSSLPHAEVEQQTFDSEGRIINDLTYQGKYKDTEYDYTYFANGLVATITEIGYGLTGDPDRPTISNKWKYAYDKRGRLSEWTRYTGDPSDPQSTVAKEKIEYDNVGNIKRILLNDSASGSYEYSYAYKLDSMGNWTEQLGSLKSEREALFIPEGEVDRVITYFPSEIATITTDGLRIRSESDLSGAILGYLNTKERATVLETSAGRSTIDGLTAPWYRVRTATGLKGWIFGGYVAIKTEQ